MLTRECLSSNVSREDSRWELANYLCAVWRKKSVYVGAISHGLT
jgi:hypothetical protein